MDLWLYFKGFDPLMIPLMLALFSLGIGIPLHAVFGVWKPYGGLLPNRPRFLWVSMTILEELIFRIFILQFLFGSFEPFLAVALTTLLYMFYGGIFHGRGFMGDAIAIMGFLSIAMFEFGLFVAIAAHFIYRILCIGWMR